MITVTPEAARQILAAAEQGQMQHLSLRIAARQAADGSLEYGMGFDEVKDDDLAFNCEGIAVICDPQFEVLLKGATLDFVELEPGDHRFIFLNPNDPHYRAPGEGCGSGGCGSGGSCCSSDSGDSGDSDSGEESGSGSSGGCGSGCGCSH